MTKEDWIIYFRTESDKELTSLNQTNKSRNIKTSSINKYLTSLRDRQINKIKENSRLESYFELIRNENLEQTKNITSALINEMLTITYASYIVMLEARNKIWPYDYMTFSRRIGELWEPFCKLPFYYSVNRLQLIPPPDFKQIQSQIKKEFFDFVNTLQLQDAIKQELKHKYTIPWTMVDSGGINLELDMHFMQEGICYNCDFKSGFNSNEKGNTNRLLLVASIYHSINNNKNLLFVRQKEDKNNHYLQTLKNSPYWEVYCADECYTTMSKFTGYDLRKWIDNNINWINDISSDFRKHLQTNDLLKYLTW